MGFQKNNNNNKERKKKIKLKKNFSQELQVHENGFYSFAYIFSI